MTNDNTPETDETAADDHEAGGTVDFGAIVRLREAMTGLAKLAAESSDEDDNMHRHLTSVWTKIIVRLEDALPPVLHKELMELVDTEFDLPARQGVLIGSTLAGHWIDGVASEMKQVLALSAANAAPHPAAAAAAALDRPAAGAGTGQYL